MYVYKLLRILTNFNIHSKRTQKPSILFIAYIPIIRKQNSI